MLTRKFQEASLFIREEAAMKAAAEINAKYNGVAAAQVTSRVRRLVDRWNVEHGYAVQLHTIDGSELYLAEAA